MVASDFVGTSLGRLHVRRSGSGPPAVLWHSLFIDSTSWGPLVDFIAANRSVIAIDGPSHGRSEAVPRNFAFADVVIAAVEALDELGITDPVDWVGNAWGGHVGIQLAARVPARIRTLTTIGTPVPGLTARERWTMVWPLVQLYRLAGPNRFLLKALSEALLGSEAIAAQPDRAAEIMESFASAQRSAMFHAMESMMLRRPGMADELSKIPAPSLLLAARGDDMGWQPADAAAAAATMRDGRAGAVDGTGHVSPLLIDTDTIASELTEFWRAVQPV